MLDGAVPLNSGTWSRCSDCTTVASVSGDLIRATWLEIVALRSAVLPPSEPLLSPHEVV